MGVAQDFDGKLIAVSVISVFSYPFTERAHCFLFSGEVPVCIIGVLSYDSPLVYFFYNLVKGMLVLVGFRGAVRMDSPGEISPLIVFLPGLIANGIGFYLVPAVSGNGLYGPAVYGLLPGFPVLVVPDFLDFTRGGSYLGIILLPGLKLILFAV